MKKILIALTLINSSLIGSFNYKKHALPSGPIRSKLDHIFRHEKNFQALKNDASFKELESWHWLTGSICANGQKYVVKAAIHPAAKKIKPPNPLWGAQIHGEKQNISRLKKAHYLKKLIKRFGLSYIRIPQTWIYPLSGNNQDLDGTKPIDDTKILIVQEFITGPKKLAWCSSMNEKVQQAAIQLSFRRFLNLFCVAILGRIVDLHPLNYKIDDTGAIALIDLEDLLAYERKSSKQNSLISRARLKLFIS